MSQTLERSLVLLKPDAIDRGLIGEIVTRFERTGLKIAGLKLVWSDKDTALNHYTQDLADRRGQHVRDLMVDMITSGPIVAIVIEGVEAVEVVRKMVAQLPEHQKKDTIEMLKRSVADIGRTLGL